MITWRDLPLSDDKATLLPVCEDLEAQWRIQVISEPIPDIQSLPDARNIPIDKVGVKGLRYPIAVKDRQKERQHTIGLFDLFVNLPHDFKEPI
jgi:hypothetical protein